MARLDFSVPDELLDCAGFGEMATEALDAAAKILEHNLKQECEKHKRTGNMYKSIKKVKPKKLSDGSYHVIVRPTGMSNEYMDKKGKIHKRKKPVRNMEIMAYINLDPEKGKNFIKSFFDESGDVIPEAIAAWSEKINSSTSMNSALENKYNQWIEIGKSKFSTAQGQETGRNYANSVNDGIQSVPIAAPNIDNSEEAAASGADTGTAYTQATEDAVNSASNPSDNYARAMEQKDLAYSSGINTAQGFINGMQSKFSDVLRAGITLGKGAVRGINVGIDAHSPSRKSAQSADYFAEGFIQQLERRQRDMEQTVIESAQLVTAAMYTWQPPDYSKYQAAPSVDTAAITAAVKQGINEANITVGFDYRGFKRGLDKYEQ